MQIKETGLKFNGPLKPRTRTNRIIIHHTATPGDVAAETVHTWHLNQGWAGIGYHYLIRQDGTVERGRPENVIGAHAGPEGNSDSIGIALAGNFEIVRPTEKQMEALVWLIRDLIKRYGELQIIGHRDVIATSCPGKLFPLEEVKRKIKEENKNVDSHAGSKGSWKLDIIREAKDKGLITIDHDPDEIAPKWFVLAVALNLLKLKDGK
ncbi:N-acetylmuramoyl-L-alanine amidase [Thermosyntropha lipolytica DSM 11003]|uniref:N-acetylmuramoyl-L-alanine amidase n=1 Tax=Thermosyntropha lipolytica DSM 11003 TaxID=1123382 RepID=A0A1M5L6V6_9FIRM|nr:peptidoglycan recognition family protein [Thermosyntropha lipolytica]SHG60645.1 N-acetylmuramoyl-L-alanine amidase [Thermosyntropha lipolytica DSM 11003]